MSENEAVFQVYHNGKFKISIDNGTSYVGGEVHTLISNPASLFVNLMESLIISLSGQRIWYKLPFEELADLKVLEDGTANFKKMCDAVFWTKAADVFLEREDFLEGVDAVVDQNKDNGAENRAALHDEIPAEESVSEEDSEAGENNGDDERVDEDGITEEEEQQPDNSEDTPPNSDDEDGGVQRRFLACKKGSGELQLAQVFDSIAEFKEAVVDYVLKEGYNVKYTKWGSEQSRVKCALGGDCPFVIYCAFEKPIERYMIKTFVKEHTCMKDGHSKVIKDGVIAKLFLNDIKKNPDYRPSDMQDAFEEKYNIAVSNDQCRKAKRKALDIIQAEHDEQFARLKDYRLALIDSNSNSTVEVRTVKNGEGKEIFDCFYVCFANLRKTWRTYCRPIIGLDGCFLKNNVEGQLLAAIGRDANNQFFPVAWGVVKKKNTDSWLWFIKLLKNDLNLQDGSGFTIISDRQKGLINAVDQELPKVEHRMCARHIYGNLRRIYPGKELPKALFWAVAKSYNIGEYDKAIKEFKEFDFGIYEEMMKRNPRNCSRAFFSCTSVCEDVSNNFSESYNNSINKARSMPLVEMLETIRRQAMIRMDVRRKKAMKHQGKYSPKVASTIKAEEKQRMYCRVIPSGNGEYEVKEHTVSYTVDMVAKTCACRRWNMTGIPCRHVLRVLLYRKLDPQDYVSNWYLTSKWRNQYSNPIRSVNGIDLWRKSGETKIQPPPREESHGPNKKQKRIKGKNESPKKKNKGKEVVEEAPEKIVKLTREGRISHCRGCGSVGHNIRKCPTTVYVPKPKVTRKPDVVECGDGPSQTQPSQNGE
ncbi:uncharacterized protein LOC112088710 [Eutrema salsugineum]|uniref:uncharacterized protein LOC112088710 n=1 Tax=Eutrema salsugineum TaxID=72664 RepID=UPI000CED549F|nr:uncharacterized protein LOC112088710 [Eutrema salsugineum]